MRKLAVLLVVAWSVCAVGRGDGAERPFGQKVCPRGEFQNARIAFERSGRGTVAFLGGSITEMNGYRPMICELLQKRFPRTAFTFINAGISSTCSTTGAFRFGADVLAKGAVDLLFVEFAVNDDQDGHHTRAECVRGMEGILRQARRANPNMDVVMTFFVNEGMLKTCREGRVPLTVDAHTAVAERYGVSTVNLAQEVADEISAGSLTWPQYGGVHPAPFGNAICARMIGELLAREWTVPLAAGAAEKALPLPEPLDSFSYGDGRFVAPSEAKIKGGWTLGVPDWKSLPGGKRERFASIPMLCATAPGAELTLAFGGTAVGAFVVAGPDAGVVEASIDGGAFKPVDLLHAYSVGLHYPRTVLFGAELAPGSHVLSLRVASEAHGTGHAVRIIQFVAN